MMALTGSLLEDVIPYLPIGGLCPLTAGIWKSQKGLRTLLAPVGVRTWTSFCVTMLGTLRPYLDLLVGSVQSGLGVAQSLVNR